MEWAFKVDTVCRSDVSKSAETCAYNFKSRRELLGLARLTTSLDRRVRFQLMEQIGSNWKRQDRNESSPSYMEQKSLINHFCEPDAVVGDCRTYLSW